MSSKIQDLHPLITLGSEIERAEKRTVERIRARLRELFFGSVVARGGTIDLSDVDAEMSSNRWYLTWAIDDYTLEMINESYIVHDSNDNYSFVIDGNGTNDIMDVKWCIRNKNGIYRGYGEWCSVAHSSQIQLFKTADALRWIEKHQEAE